MRQPTERKGISSRGTLHARLGRGQAAVRDWEAYLQRAPDGSDAAQVKGRLQALRQALGSQN